jgi:hypothetical protein
MRILFDQGTPVRLRRHLTGHSVTTAFEQGWSTLLNGQLLDAAERAGFDLLIATDQNLRYQQSLHDRQLAILVLLSTSCPHIQQHIAAIRTGVELVTAGSYQEIPIEWFLIERLNIQRSNVQPCVRARSFSSHNSIAIVSEARRCHL